MEGTLIQCEVSSVRSLVDGSVRITLDTPEISGSKAGELFDLRKNIAYCYISPKAIESNVVKMVNALDPELRGKTPGQRLRGVMFRMWEQNNEGYSDSESFYIAKMELIINTYKSQLL